MKTQIEVLRRIRADLEWRGPTGKTLGTIVLSRDDAVALLDATEADAILVAMLTLTLRLRELLIEKEPCPSS